MDTVSRRCETSRDQILSVWCGDLVLMFLLLQDYPYFGTSLDTKESLYQATGGKLLDVAASAAQMAGQMALRLVHDHILDLDVSEYNRVFMKNINKITGQIRNVRFSFFFFSPDEHVVMMRWNSGYSQEL